MLDTAKSGKSHIAPGSDARPVKLGYSPGYTLGSVCHNMFANFRASAYAPSVLHQQAFQAKGYGSLTESLWAYITHAEWTMTSYAPEDWLDFVADAVFADMVYTAGRPGERKSGRVKGSGRRKSRALCQLPPYTARLMHHASGTRESTSTELKNGNPEHVVIASIRHTRGSGRAWYRRCRNRDQEGHCGRTSTMRQFRSRRHRARRLGLHLPRWSL